MSPAGTLSNVMRSPRDEPPTTQTPQTVNGTLSDQHQVEVVTMSNGHCSGSVPNVTLVNQNEERYVMGAF